ncbi:MAG: hypothetical protein ABI954_13045 [Pyrinomonadaceae bacterium]
MSHYQSLICRQLLALVAGLILSLPCIVMAQRRPTVRKTPTVKPVIAETVSTTSSNAKTAILKIGEGINFASGKVTKSVAESDMSLKYLPPQSGYGSRYNVMTQQMEYQSTLRTTENYPLLSAARTASFETRPNPSDLTVGDVNSWTEDAFQIKPGRFLIVRGNASGEHYIVHIQKFGAPSNNPQTWQVVFSYEPIQIALGAPKTAGKNLPLSGTLSYREVIFSKKIINLNLATGKTTEVFDGYGVSRNQKGEYAYLNQAVQVVIADASGKEIVSLPSPARSAKSYGSDAPSEVALSPNGDFIAVQVERSEPITAGGYTLAGISMACVVVINRQGKEIAAFYKKQGAAWTPDNRLIVAQFVNPGLYISDLQVKKLQPIKNSPQMEHTNYLAVSPDGKTVAFSANGRVWTMNLDGTNFKQLTSSGLSEITPVWSPDGKYIAIQQIDPNSINNGSYRIVVVRLSDGYSVPVTDQYGWTREPAGRMSWLE